MQFPVEDIQVRTLVDRGLKVTLTVPELDNPSTAELLGMRDTEACWCLLAPARIKDEPELPELSKPIGQTPSQRLRAVLFLLWKQDKSPMEFDRYYEKKMRELIEWIKTKLDE
jgi:hypothetical protein